MLRKSSPLLGAAAATPATAALGGALTSALDTINFAADAGVVVDPELDIPQDTAPAAQVQQQPVLSLTGPNTTKKTAMTGPKTQVSTPLPTPATTATKPTPGKQFVFCTFLWSQLNSCNEQFCTLNSI